MRCKDMPKEPRRYQIILCDKCFNSGGTMIRTKDGWEHPECERPLNVQNKEKAVPVGVK